MTPQINCFNMPDRREFVDHYPLQAVDLTHNRVLSTHRRFDPNYTTFPFPFRRPETPPITRLGSNRRPALPFYGVLAWGKPLCQTRVAHRKIVDWLIFTATCCTVSTMEPVLGRIRWL
jgi:hypothetical protein